MTNSNSTDVGSLSIIALAKSKSYTFYLPVLSKNGYKLDWSGMLKNIPEKAKKLKEYLDNLEDVSEQWKFKATIKVLGFYSLNPAKFNCEFECICKVLESIVVEANL